MSAIRAIIADDEEPLREALRRRLATVWPELQVVGEARNGLEALEQIARQEPDIAFLDIRMPGLDGLEVARRLTGRCHVVFVTAYDDYAVQAFEEEAIDYVLKPVTEERLARTAARLRERLARIESPLPLADLLQRLQAAPGAYLRWIRAGERDAVRMIAVESVLCFVAADKYTSVHTAQGEHLIRKPIKELESELDPERFWRVHRSAIVNVECIEACRRDEEGHPRLSIRGLDAEIPVSRAYAHLFKQM